MQILSHLSFIFTDFIMAIAFFAAALISAVVAVPAPSDGNGGPRIAIAVLNENGGPWGSIVFKQSRRRAPVQVQAFLQNVPTGAGKWEIYNEPVHYSNPQDTRCSTSSLRGILPNGELHHKHGRISSSRLSAIGWDADLSLYEGEKGFIIQKSLAIDNNACATIYRVRMDVIPGLVPCEVHSWDDCVVSVGNGKCRKQPCQGFQQFWKIEYRDYSISAIQSDTLMCIQHDQTTPKVIDYTEDEHGNFPCTLGTSSALYAV